MMSATLLRAQLVCAMAVLPTLLLWGSGRLAQLLPALGQQADIAEPASRCVPHGQYVLQKTGTHHAAGARQACWPC